MSVEVGNLTWPKDKHVAVIVRASGDPWTDLDSFKLAHRVSEENGLPRFVVDELEFPSPDEQRAAMTKEEK
ncbi:MAG: hypothetical protein ACTHQQ_24340 [Solirubrobacteraceae bacterium]